MKRVISVVAVVAAGLTSQAQTEQTRAAAAENLKKRSVVGKVIDDLKESTRNVRQINKENLVEVKETFSTIHAEATTNPDFEKFRKTKGFKNKVKVVAENMKEGCRENSEKERERRAQIRSHESYRNLLELQKIKREAIVSR